MLWLSLLLVAIALAWSYRGWRRRQDRDRPPIDDVLHQLRAPAPPPLRPTSASRWFGRPWPGRDVAPEPSIRVRRLRCRH